MSSIDRKLDLMEKGAEVPVETKFDRSAATPHQLANGTFYVVLARFCIYRIGLMLLQLSGPFCTAGLSTFLTFIRVPR